MPRRQVMGLRDISFQAGRCQTCGGSGVHPSGKPCRVCGEAPPRPAVVRDCEIVLTAAPKTNGKMLRVRCACMSGSAQRVVDHRLAYDHLGDAPTIPEAVALWREHADVRAT